MVDLFELYDDARTCQRQILIAAENSCLLGTCNLEPVRTVHLQISSTYNQ